MRITSLFAFLFFLSFYCYSQKQKIALHLIKGQTYSQVSSTRSSIIETINDQKVDIDLTVSAKMSYKVIESASSLFDMEVSYENLSMLMKLPSGNNIEFNSEKHDESDVFSKILSAIIGKFFLVKMSDLGKIIKVEGLDSLFSEVIQNFQQLSEIQKQQIQEQLMKAYGEKAFKGSIESVSAIFPESPVSVGDKWIIKTQLESGMAVKVESEYQLRKMEDTFYQIYGESKLITADKDAYIQSNGMPMKYDLKGEGFSEIKIDKNSGWIIESKLNENIKGTGEIKDNEKLPGGLKIPMIITIETAIKET